MNIHERARAAWAAAQKAEQEQKAERERAEREAEERKINALRQKFPDHVVAMLDEMGATWYEYWAAFPSLEAAPYHMDVSCNAGARRWEVRYHSPYAQVQYTECDEETLESEILCTYGRVLEALERARTLDQIESLLSDETISVDDQADDQGEQPQSEYLHTIEEWKPTIEAAAAKANRRADPFIQGGFFLRGIRIITEEEGYTYVIALEKGRPTPWEMVP